MIENRCRRLSRLGNPLFLLTSKLRFQFLLLARILRTTKFEQRRRKRMQEIKKMDANVTSANHPAEILQGVLCRGRRVSY